MRKKDKPSESPIQIAAMGNRSGDIDFLPHPRLSGQPEKGDVWQMCIDTFVRYGLKGEREGGVVAEAGEGERARRGAAKSLLSC